MGRQSKSYPPIPLQNPIAEGDVRKILRENPDIYWTEHPFGPEYNHLIDGNPAVNQKDVEIYANLELTSWSALDEILRAMILKGSASSREKETRLAKARAAILALEAGRPKVHNWPVLQQIANEYYIIMMENIQERGIIIRGKFPTIEIPPNVFRKIVEKVVEKKYWDRQSEDEKMNTIRRLKRHFKENYQLLMTEVKAWAHPAQRDRAAKVDKVIAILAELGLAQGLVTEGG
jgi:hypothetical protein